MFSHILRHLVSGFRSTQQVELRKDTATSVSGAFDTVQIALLVAILYYAGTKVGIFFKPAGIPISIFWPPNALLLAAFLLTPKRLWWAILAAVLPAHLLAQLPAGVPIARMLGWLVGNTGEALLGAICICYFRKQERLFDSVRGLITFLVFGVLGAPLLTSFLDVGIVQLTGRVGSYWTLWMMRLSSNMIANMTVVPTVLFFGRNGVSWLRKATFERWVEACVLVFGVVFVSVVVFNRDYTQATHLPALAFAPLPFLLWASIRFGSGALSASILVVVVIASWNEVHGNGLLPSASTPESVLYLHILLTLFALPSMVLAAVIAERRRAEELLQATRNKLIQEQEQERHRIARELHDDLAQQLTLLGLELNQLRTGLAPSLKLRLQGLHDQLVGISNATRDLSHELHPFALEYLGLVAALRTLCRRVGVHNNLNVTFSEQNVPARLDASVSLCLYRVTQEALQNISAQSKARAVKVELKVVWGQAWLLIADDGLGVSPEQMCSGSVGLAGARERLMGLNGTLKIMSEPQKGTTIEASVPLPPS
jgi:signal transduction histidine kinase